MRALLCGLIFAALTFAGTDEVRPKTGVIALYHEFAYEPPPVVRAAIEDELDAIMGPIGMRFEWRNLKNRDNPEPTTELAVITFKGRCDVSGLLTHGVYDPGALGWTHISDGQILPFADIDCGEIRGFLQRALYKLLPAKREEAFGRAAGRVLAHELYHIFADTTRHGSCGVAKESYTIEDLLSPAFRFQDKESRELRNSKAAIDSAPEPH
jgi:hypothetical protein